MAFFVIFLAFFLFCFGLRGLKDQLGVVRIGLGIQFCSTTWTHKQVTNGNSKKTCFSQSEFFLVPNSVTWLDDVQYILCLKAKDLCHWSLVDRSSLLLQWQQTCFLSFEMCGIQFTFETSIHFTLERMSRWRPEMKMDEPVCGQNIGGQL